MKKVRLLKVLPLLSFLLFPGIALVNAEDRNYSPYADRDFPEALLWGDTHVHTNLSSDAYSGGNNLTSEQAYRFARGEEILANTGQAVRLNRPLDFLVVTDHAEYLGVSALLDSDAEKLANSEIGQHWLTALAEGKKMQVLLDGHQATMGYFNKKHDENVSRDMWRRVIDVAEHYNEPGQFTTFIGYEWTALPNGNNLHRNVVFADGADKVMEVQPFSALDSRDPEDLWAYLEEYENSTSGQVLAIPHNANVSNGLMFSDKTLSGNPLDRSYAQARLRWEPVVEMTQIKGDGEAHPFLSPDDEFADFENWDSGNFNLPRDAKKNEMLEFEYARAALKNGLVLERELGVNPFKFGMIGSSDTHIALSAIEENNYFGKFGNSEPSAGRIDHPVQPAYAYAAAGYAAVWAEENTRESIFAAMKRREVYATTGPRINVRFFGGWHYDINDAHRPDYVSIGYAKGVPMGGDLSAAPENTRPRFLIVVSKDPAGAHLDRVQLVKGWLDVKGELHEKVYDVAWAGDRKPSKETGKLPPIGSTVDVNTASYTNTIGEPLLATVWEDQEFDPQERAFYYLRALEIPVPRWSTYDSVFYDMPLTDKMPAEIQERAYTSPIWYTP